MKRYKKGLRPQSFDQRGTIRGVVRQWLSYGGAPCLGYWGLYYDDGGILHTIRIPGLELDTAMGDGAEVEIEYTFRVVGRGRVPTKECMNPWPLHRHDRSSRRRGRS